MKGHASSPVLFNLVLEYAIRRVQANHEGLKVNGTLQLLIYVGDVSIVSGNTYTAKKNTKSLIATSEQIGVAVNAEEAKHMAISCDQQAGQNHNITTVHKSSERAEQVNYLGTTLTNENSIQEDMKRRLKSGNACHHSVQNLLSSSFLSRNIKIKIHKTVILPVVLYGCDLVCHTEGGTEAEGVCE